jgi:hypothetical protein
MSPNRIGRRAMRKKEVFYEIPGTVRRRGPGTALPDPACVRGSVPDPRNFALWAGNKLGRHEPGSPRLAGRLHANPSPASLPTRHLLWQEVPEGNSPGLPRIGAAFVPGLRYSQHKTHPADCDRSSKLSCQKTSSHLLSRNERIDRVSLAGPAATCPQFRDEPQRRARSLVETGPRVLRYRIDRRVIGPRVRTRCRR